MTTPRSNRPLRLLVLDGESVHALNVAWALRNLPQVRLFVLSTKQLTPLHFSNSVERVIPHAIHDDAAMVDLLRVEVTTHAIDLVMACETPAILFLARNRDLLSPFVHVVPVPSLQQISRADDKWLAALDFMRCGVRTPRTVPLDRDAARLGFPFLIKPRRSLGGIGILKIHDVQQFHRAFDKIGSARESFVAQEFLAGQDMGCGVLCRDGRVLAHTTQRPINTRRKSFTSTRETRIEAHPAALELVEKMMAALQWNGVANIDLRETADRQIHVIEINPRYWGSLSASIYAGVNFPYLAILDCIGESFASPRYDPASFFGFGNWIRGTRAHRHWIPPLSRTTFADPLPKFAERTLRLCLAARNAACRAVGRELLLPEPVWPPPARQPAATASRKSRLRFG